MLKYPFLIGLLTVSTLGSADDTFEQELAKVVPKSKALLALVRNFMIKNNIKKP